MSGQPSPYSQALKRTKPNRAALGKQHRWIDHPKWMFAKVCMDCNWELFWGAIPRFYKRGRQRWTDLSVAKSPPCYLRAVETTPDELVIP